MQTYKLLRFPHKEIRAAVIKEYMQYCGYEKAVCFSCGNAAAALINKGIDTLHIGDKGVLTPCKWFTQAEIKKYFSEYFDATSGHLSVSLMQEIGERYKKCLGNLTNKIIYVPSGSGETFVCLKLAYPTKNFVAVYNLDEATKYNENAPLNDLVKCLAYKIIFADKK